MLFDTLVNFRDLGDYKTKDGRQIVSKRLLRSGELYDLSEHDINILTNDYHLTQIIDLRSAKETKKHPDSTISNAKYHNIDMFKGDEKEAPALEQIEKEKANLSADERMFYAYKHLIISPTAQQGFRDFFQILLHNETGATIWHCFAGKDRTGLTSALVLYILGASKETIYEDYMRTNAARKIKNEETIALLKAEGASEKNIKDTLTMLNVKKEYLDYALKIITDEYESVDNYIDNILGITEADKTKFRTLYLVDTP